MKAVISVVMLLLTCSTVYGEGTAAKKKSFVDAHQDVNGLTEQVRFREELATMGHTIFFKALESRPKMMAAIDYAVEQEGDAHSRKLLLLQNMRIIELLEKLTAARK